MKKILKSIFALAILFNSAYAFAQDQAPKKSPQDKAYAQLQWMKQNIGLADDQNQKVFMVLFQAAKDMDKAMDAPQGTDKKQAMQDIQNTKNTQLKEMLTADQFTKYQAHEQEMKAKWQDHKMQQSGN